MAQSPLLQPALQVLVWVKDSPVQILTEAGTQTPPQGTRVTGGFAVEQMPESWPPWLPSQRHW